VHFSDLGTICLALALLFAVYAVASSVLGAVRDKPALVASGRRATLMVALFMVMAAISLIASFLLRDFAVKYVADHSNRAMPWYYTLAAFYGGQEGSLLYWAMMLSVFSAIAVLLYRRAPAALMPYVVATLMSIELFFLFMLNFISTPFTRTRVAPLDGLGLNPVLEDPGMLIHPPLLLMGYMSFSVPFAFALAALITGNLNSNWLRSIRRWALTSWTIQSAGLLMGAWWAYHVLGWGGYWGWDPVENAALLPWLTATAFLHSTMVQERRGTLKMWNLSLIVASFLLSIFGTFEVRSGIISSVHSFAYSSLGSYFLGFFAVALVVTLALFVYRLPRLRPEQEFGAFVSREGSFLFNNFLLSGIAFATFWGTIFPIISEVVRGQTMTVGSQFYQQVNGPLFLVLLAAMGLGPLLAWRKAKWSSIWHNGRWPALAAAVCALILPLAGVSNIWANIGFTVCAFGAGTIAYEVWRGMRVRHGHGESYPIAFWQLVVRHRQRYGGYLVHLGLIVLAVGVIGSQLFQQEQDANLHVGQSMTLSGYTVTFTGASQSTTNGIQTILAHFTVSQQGQTLGTIAPGQRIFPGFETQPTSIVSITTYGLRDLYVFLSSVDGTSTASIRIFVNPLVSLIWMGGLILLAGGIFCWWPERRRTVRLVEASQPERVEARV